MDVFWRWSTATISVHKPHSKFAVERRFLDRPICIHLDLVANKLGNEILTLLVGLARISHNLALTHLAVSLERAFDQHRHKGEFPI